VASMVNYHYPSKGPERPQRLNSKTDNDNRL
jgi:hypothetical protein